MILANVRFAFYELVLFKVFSFNYFEVRLAVSFWLFLVEGYLLPLIFKLI